MWFNRLFAVAGDHRKFYTVSMDVADSDRNWCLSGGAPGADLQWGAAAAYAGHRVIHFSFKGHVTTAPAEQVMVLPEAALAVAEHPCRRAGKYLQRRYPPKSRYVTNLLRRNWFQVESASSLYAVGSFERGHIAGGTAWAIAMFLQKFEFTACAAYVFDQTACYWYVWDGHGWQKIYEPPTPSGVWAGIGSRQLSATGRLAINVALNYDAKKARIAALLKT